MNNQIFWKNWTHQPINNHNISSRLLISDEQFKLNNYILMDLQMDNRLTGEIADSLRPKGVCRGALTTRAWLLWFDGWLWLGWHCPFPKSQSPSGASCHQPGSQSGLFPQHYSSSHPDWRHTAPSGDWIHRDRQCQPSHNQPSHPKIQALAVSAPLHTSLGWGKSEFSPISLLSIWRSIRI